MKYDFTSILERSGNDAMAVDGLGAGFAPDPPEKGFEIIPMWIADMNFPVCPSITKAMADRIAHPAFGYFDAREEYYDKIIQWHRERNGVDCMKKEHIGYENGVLGGVVNALNVLCSKGDNVLVHSPTYIGFTFCLEDNGYNIVHSPLTIDEKGIWRMDFADMEEKIVKNNIHTAIFCNPHNPSGRVWEPWEIEKAMEIYKKHDVYVISDEIWSDIILSGYKHTPTQMVSEDARMRTIAFYAPSKTFSLAGLIGSYRVVYNNWLKDRLAKESSLCHYNVMNVISMHALIGAYTDEGKQWLEELRQVITENVDYACTYIEERFKGVKAYRPEGTYVLFVDCADWCKAHNKTIEDVENAAWRVGVAVQDGKMFHGPCHLRFNLALPLSKIKEAFDRLDKYVFNTAE